jgi:hypothetical protein
MICGCKCACVGASENAATKPNCVWPGALEGGPAVQSASATCNSGSAGRWEQKSVAAGLSIAAHWPAKAGPAECTRPGIHLIGAHGEKEDCEISSSHSPFSLQSFALDRVRN